MLRLALLTAFMTAPFTVCVTFRLTQTLPPAPDNDGLRGAYSASGYLAPFGSQNHYLDGWWDYEETVSAARFISGIGAVMPPPSLGYTRRGRPHARRARRHTWSPGNTIG
jgi:hypothetical protein